MDRRRFLGLAGAATGAAVVGGAAWRGLLAEHVQDATATSGTTTTFAPAGPFPATGSASGRVLVLVQLGGGNDGLNTLVPVGDGRYHDARPTLAVAPGDVRALVGNDHYGLHPSLDPLVSLWEAGHLVGIDGVGFPDQTRSHFTAMDTWWSAQPDQARTTGWLGRWLDATGDGTNPLRAVSLGLGSPAVVGEHSLATVVLDPAGFVLRAPRGADADQLTAAFLATAQPLAADPLLASAQQAVPATLDAVGRLAQASGSTDPGDNGLTLTGLFDVAAGIIDQQLGTEVLTVGISGFDTHTNQAADQPGLLADLGGGLRSFLDKIDAQGRRDQVLVLVTSEFGRRVQENGSGTDHGDGGLALLAGAAASGGQIVGQADLGSLQDGDLPLEIDARSAYAAVLDWLGGPTDDVLGGSFDRLGLVAT